LVSFSWFCDGLNIYIWISP